MTGAEIISIHTLRVEGDPSPGQRCGRRRISIHTLRVEGDGLYPISITAQVYFNPHPPRGG